MNSGLKVCARLGIAVVACLAIPVASAQAYAVIESSGPIAALHVGDDLSCQVSYGDPSYEFYPPQVAPGDCGVFLVVDGTLFAPDFPGHERTATSGLGVRTAFEPVSQTDVQGAGTAASPFLVETVASAPGADIEVRQQITYITGEASFRVDVSVSDRRQAPRNIRLYYAADCYASGSDIGYGFTRPEIGSAGCSQNVNNVPPARTIQFSPLSAGSHYVEDRFYNVWERIGAQTSLPGTCLCPDSVDNGVGLSWDIALPSVTTTTRSLNVSFTEATRAAPPVDSDGDELPDAWETGTSGASDATNLAPLGANPGRKDIFVHADYMTGCAPPAGWERQAIAMFASKGIALHVDSGPTSLNDDLNPWGARSRAGEVTAADLLTLQDWSGLDDRKDERFVPANRRRAFHYVLFSKQYTTLQNGAVVTKDGGVSRGIPDADLVIAQCHLAADKRGETAVFVHELGHNLGLRHGGADSVNFKPNYHSEMNYSWVWRDVDKGTLTGYSSTKRADLNEGKLDERVKLDGPLIWWCLDTTKSTDKAYSFTQSMRTQSGPRKDLDLDCDGTLNEEPGQIRQQKPGSGFLGLGKEWIYDVNMDAVPSNLVSHDDWSVLNFGGGGILGPLDLPPRADTPPVPEITSPEVAASAAAAAADTTRLSKQILVRVTAGPKRAGGRVRMTVKVTLRGKNVRQARVRVKGAVLSRGKRYVVTNRRGSARLTFKAKRGARIVVTAGRKGSIDGGVALQLKR